MNDDTWVVVVEWLSLVTDEWDVVAVHGPYTWDVAQDQYWRLRETLNIVNERVHGHVVTCFQRAITSGPIDVDRYIEAVSHEPAQ